MKCQEITNRWDDRGLVNCTAVCTYKSSGGGGGGGKNKNALDVTLKKCFTLH